MTLKRLDKLLNSKAENALDELVHRAQDMDDLAVVLQRAVPGVESGEIVAANLRDNGDLVVVCRSSSWAARLRFENERLLAAARAKGYPAERCRIRVGRQA